MLLLSLSLFVKLCAISIVRNVEEKIHWLTSSLLVVMIFSTFSCPPNSRRFLLDFSSLRFFLEACCFLWLLLSLSLMHRHNIHGNMSL